jgi:hypothetical protein
VAFLKAFNKNGSILKVVALDVKQLPGLGTKIRRHLGLTHQLVNGTANKVL